ARTGDHRRAIEQHTPQVRLAFQDCGDEAAVTAANVDDCLEAAKVVNLRKCFGVTGCRSSAQAVVNRPVLRIALYTFGESDGIEMIIGRHSRTDAVEAVAGRTPPQLRAERVKPLRTRRISLE